uniref:Uncharacterized protein n=1 Tax=Glossina pallidipes TaxID=7398 RepID=A0A1A9ZAG1_GLOPL
MRTSNIVISQEEEEDEEEEEEGFMCIQKALISFPLMLLLNRKSDKNLIKSLCSMQLAAHKHTDICTSDSVLDSYLLDSLTLKHLQQRRINTSALAKLTLSLVIEGEFVNHFT